MFASNNVSFIQRHSPEPPVAHTVAYTNIPEKTFGKVSFLNSDGSVFTSGVIVPEGQITRYFGRITSKPVLKIKSASDGIVYTQEEWIDKYGPQVSRDSVYVSDPAAAAAYAQNFQKMVVLQMLLELLGLHARPPPPSKEPYLACSSPPHPFAQCL